MDVRQVKRLCQLSDDCLFQTVSEGLELILRNANRLEEDAEFLYKNNRARGFRVLRSVLEEEAAKFLILLDVVRCPKNHPNRGKHLSFFYGHLQRLLYAESCYLRLTTFREMREWVEKMREAKYVEGHDFEFWIERNELLQNREGALYVDYVKLERECTWQEGKCTWQDPTLMEGPDGTLPFCGFAPPVLELARACGKTGCTSPESLKHIAGKWRSITLRDDLHCQELEALNRETIDELKTNGLMVDDTDAEQEYIIDHWPYPLYDLDLSIKSADSSHLKNEKEIAEESAWAAELGFDEEV